MNASGNDLLAGAGLSGDQDVRIGWSNPLHESAKFLHDHAVPRQRVRDAVFNMASAIRLAGAGDLRLVHEAHEIEKSHGVLKPAEYCSADPFRESRQLVGARAKDAQGGFSAALLQALGTLGKYIAIAGVRDQRQHIRPIRLRDVLYPTRGYRYRLVIERD